MNPSEKVHRKKSSLRSRVENYWVTLRDLSEYSIWVGDYGVYRNNSFINSLEILNHSVFPIRLFHWKNRGITWGFTGNQEFILKEFFNQWL